MRPGLRLAYDPATRHLGGTAYSGDRHAEPVYATPASDTDLWTPAPDRLGSPVDLCNGVVYDHGAMTLQALREKLGDTSW
jgi:hypothetical protein